MPPLTPVLTPALIAAIRKQPNLPQNTWYFITAATLSALNRPDEMPTVFNDAVEVYPNAAAGATLRHEEQLNILRRLREALVKSSAVGGMPKSINSLLALKAVTPEDLLDMKDDVPSSRHQDVYEASPSQILERGQSFFNTLYGKISKRVMGQMDRSGTKDLGLMARLMYGYLLSNTDVLTPVETSFVLIASLIPQDVNPQLKGHLRGALNGGATVEEVRAVRDVVIKICEASGMKKLNHDAVGGWGWRDEVATV